MRHLSDRRGGWGLVACHVAVGALVCLFVLSPALFTPRGFGKDYSNHLWLVWQQGLAISSEGHPTLYVQLQSGVFQPLYGFYGGSLYALFGALSALLGNDAYAAFVVSIGTATALSYGGAWWLGSQLGASRWAAHLPAFVVVTAAYYLTDVYARGAWPEFMALSAVPMFAAGGARLLTSPWRAGTVTLFVLATVLLTGSHNITLLWSVMVIGPVAIVAWLAAGKRRIPLLQVAKVASVALLSLGINAWFLVLDVTHSDDVAAWNGNKLFLTQYFSSDFFFDTFANVLDLHRSTPAKSGTYGLTIAAPVLAFAMSLALVALAWPQLRRAGRPLKALWLILLVAIATLVVLMVMPADWWLTLGSPFTYIQFPYRLAGWLLMVIAAQLAISLSFARSMSRRRRNMAVLVGTAVVATTIIQASAQLYSGPRLRGEVNNNVHSREVAFANGPTTAPETYYDGNSYADGSLPVVQTKENRIIVFPVPQPGATSSSLTTRLPSGTRPFSTNVLAGPYAVQIEGLPVIGRTLGGAAVLQAPLVGHRRVNLVVTADGGSSQTVAGTLSLLSLSGVLVILGWVTVARRRRALRTRNDGFRTATHPHPS